ncbi:MAG: DUF3604 domain-containing protein [Azospirillaceae bacterium]
MADQILFGDIHNHNALGYGIGSLERAIDVARTHLDFFAFTGHSSWHDMVAMEGGREQHWIKGFARLQEGWPQVQSLIAEANEDGAFNAFLGFEWHSSHFGDQCVVFPGDHRPLAYPDTVDGLRAFCLEEKALMIPHHLGYPEGHRGVNWSVFDEACTPVVEIFSEHGNAEHDRGPYPYFSHSMGGRDTTQTARDALARGLRFGFVASSDSHSGFPGAYDEGLLGVHAEARTRTAIMAAIRERRTYALTGDRMGVWFDVGGRPMGSTIEAGSTVEARFRVEGRDEMDVVELIQDGRAVHHAYPADPLAEPAPGEPFQVRLEWGWGPWGDLALDRVCDWEFAIEVSGGRILEASPCLRSGPFDENRRHRVIRRGESAVDIVSYTGRAGAYRQNPNHSVVLTVAGGADLALAVTMRKPVEDRTVTGLAELARTSVSRFTGPFPKESWQWHRLVPLGGSVVDGRHTLDLPAGRPSHVYLRARQANGQMAWASPVFINRR